MSTSWDLGARARRLDSRGDPSFHPGGPIETFEIAGRLQLIALLRRGLTPDSHVIDVGCGALRAGYWLIHFLDRGRYHGIEPMQSSLQIARAELLEPGLEDAKAPEFRFNDDFDLGVFGVAPRFVLARSIWSHASKPQIAALLDSFARHGTADALLLASYVRAKGTDSERRPGILGRIRGGATAARTQSQKDDYRGSAWAGWGPGTPDVRGVMVAHRFDWIAQRCERRGLVARESKVDAFGGQVWVEVTRAPR
jgi:hypothetical protein